jgi:hypothetical protein
MQSTSIHIDLQNRLTKFDHQTPEALILIRRENNNTSQVILVGRVFFLREESDDCFDAILNGRNDVENNCQRG